MNKILTLLLLCLSSFLVFQASAQTTDSLYKNKSTTSPKQPVNPRVSNYKSAIIPDSAQKKVDSAVHSQIAVHDPNKPIQGGFMSASGLLLFPDGQLADNNPNAVGYGFDLTFLANLAPRRSKLEWEQRFVNIYAGGNFQFIRLNSQTDAYTTSDLFYETTIESKVKTNITHFGAQTRVEIFPGKVKLFLEAGAGLNFMNGIHTITIENTPIGNNDPNAIQEEVDNDYLRSSVIGNYSFGGGIKLGAIEIKVTSLKGSTAEQVNMETVKFNRTTNSVSYETHNSKYTAYVFQVGFQVRF